MATLTQPHYQPRTLRLSLIKKCDESIEKLIPRRCMVVSVSLILVGLGLPFLMVLGLLPVDLLLGFVGFSLTATGSVLMLVFCGEI